MKELDHDALAMKNLEKMGYQQELSRVRLTTSTLYQLPLTLRI